MEQLTCREAAAYQSQALLTHQGVSTSPSIHADALAIGSAFVLAEELCHIFNDCDLHRSLHADVGTRWRWPASGRIS